LVETAKLFYLRSTKPSILKEIFNMNKTILNLNHFSQTSRSFLGLITEPNTTVTILPYQKKKPRT
jgi:hypothetical protein